MTRREERPDGAGGEAGNKTATEQKGTSSMNFTNLNPLLCALEIKKIKKVHTLSFIHLSELLCRLSVLRLIQLKRTLLHTKV